MYDSYYKVDNRFTYPWSNVQVQLKPPLKDYNSPLWNGAREVVRSPKHLRQPRQGKSEPNYFKWLSFYIVTKYIFRWYQIWIHSRRWPWRICILIPDQNQLQSWIEVLIVKIDKLSSAIISCYHLLMKYFADHQCLGSLELLCLLSCHEIYPTHKSFWQASGPSFVNI